MWEINNSLQLSGFLYSCVLGAIYCVVYDFLRAVRSGNRTSAFIVFFQDIFYFTAAAISCFCFLLATTNGELRFYAILGILIGFVITRLTVSKLTYFIFLKITHFIRFIFTKFSNGLTKVCAFFDTRLTFFAKKAAAILKNTSYTLKKLLKKG